MTGNTTRKVSIILEARDNTAAGVASATARVAKGARDMERAAVAAGGQRGVDPFEQDVQKFIASRRRINERAARFAVIERAARRRMGSEFGSDEGGTGLAGIRDQLGSSRLLKGVLKGGLVGYAGSELAAMTEAMLKVRDLSRSTAANWTDVALEVGKSVPLVGGFVRAGENINELLTGQKKHLADIEAHAGRITKSTELYRDMLKDAAKWRKSIDQTTREAEGRLGMIGLSGTTRDLASASLAAESARGRLSIEEESQIEALKKKVSPELTELRNQYKNLVIPDIYQPPPHADSRHQQLIEDSKLAQQEALTRQAELRRQIQIIEGQNQQATLEVQQKYARLREIEDKSEQKQRAQILADAARTNAERSIRANTDYEDQWRQHYRRLEAIARDGEEAIAHAEAQAREQTLRGTGRGFQADLEAIRERGRLRRREAEEAIRQERQAVEQAGTQAGRRLAGAGRNLMHAIRSGDPRQILDALRGGWQEGRAGVMGAIQQRVQSGAVEAGESRRLRIGNELDLAEMVRRGEEERRDRDEAANRRDQENRRRWRDEQQRRVDAGRSLWGGRLSQLGRLGEAGQLEAEKQQLEMESADRRRELEAMLKNRKLGDSARKEAEAQLAGLESQKGAAYYAMALARTPLLSGVASGVDGRSYSGFTESARMEAFKMNARREEPLEAFTKENGKALDRLRTVIDSLEKRLSTLNIINVESI
jgi:hypothetical protein